MITYFFHNFKIIISIRLLDEKIRKYLIIKLDQLTLFESCKHDCVNEHVYSLFGYLFIQIGMLSVALKTISTMLLFTIFCL